MSPFSNVWSQNCSHFLPDTDWCLRGNSTIVNKPSYAGINYCCSSFTLVFLQKRYHFLLGCTGTYVWTMMKKKHSINKYNDTREIIKNGEPFDLKVEQMNEHEIVEMCTPESLPGTRAFFLKNAIMGGDGGVLVP